MLRMTLMLLWLHLDMMQCVRTKSRLQNTAEEAHLPAAIARTAAAAVDTPAKALAAEDALLSV